MAHYHANGVTTLIVGLQRLSGYTVPVRFLSVTESDIWNRLPVKFDVFQRRLVACVIIVIEP